MPAPPTPKVAEAIDLLERQACNCIRVRGKIKVLCLRCELLALLGPTRPA